MDYIQEDRDLHSRAATLLPLIKPDHCHQRTVQPDLERQPGRMQLEFRFIHLLEDHHGSGDGAFSCETNAARAVIASLLAPVGAFASFGETSKHKVAVGVYRTLRSASIRGKHPPTMAVAHPSSTSPSETGRSSSYPERHCECDNLPLRPVHAHPLPHSRLIVLLFTY